MPKRSNLPSETTIYSINPMNGALVVHHLPWPRTSPQLQKYIERGFTFENPLIEQETQKVVVEKTGEKTKVKVTLASEIDTTIFKCLYCRRKFKTEVGRSVHVSRTHKGV